jgi:hypothetical protein
VPGEIPLRLKTAAPATGPAARAPPPSRGTGR